MPKKTYLEYILDAQNKQENNDDKASESSAPIQGSALQTLKVPSINSSFEKSGEVNTFDLEFKDGSSYSGQIMKHGYGTYKDCKGNVYEGNWEHDKKHGQGKQSFVSDVSHVQNSTNDSINSIEDDFYRRGGTVSISNSIGVYEGNFDNGQFSGFGKFTFSDKSYYEGTWKQGKMDGIGTFYGSDGSVYTGEWKQNMKNGKGVYKDPQNKVLDGMWENDKFLEKKD